MKQVRNRGRVGQSERNEKKGTERKREEGTEEQIKSGRHE